MNRRSLLRECRFISWFAIVGGLLIAFSGCGGAVISSSPFAGSAMAIGGMMAFAAGLISLTLLACFAPATRTNSDTTSEPPVEATATDAGNE
jgi:hypothetical protein